MKLFKFSLVLRTHENTGIFMVFTRKEERFSIYFIPQIPGRGHRFSYVLYEHHIEYRKGQNKTATLHVLVFSLVFSYAP